MIKPLDIDWLRKNHTRLYYFGLGFIQLKIDEQFRLHFYTSYLPAINDDIHNHRYWFKSTVLKGSITNRLYVVGDGDSHVMRNESCNPDIDAPPLEKPCCATLISTKTHAAGDTYYLSDNEFHTVESDYCITLLERSPYTRELAQVVTPAGESSICPFSKKISENKLWEIMERMLNE